MIWNRNNHWICKTNDQFLYQKVDILFKVHHANLNVHKGPTENETIYLAVIK